jgi:DNA-binding SARP family transcriptional activator
MKFKVLGSLEVEGDDGPVPIVGQRPRALLTALLLHPNAVVPTGRLVDALWGEQPPESSANPSGPGSRATRADHATPGRGHMSSR